MREFSGYCVPSEEYREMYELESQQNMELREKAVTQNNIILALQRELAATKQDLSNKNATVDDVRGQLEHQKKETEEWVEKFEFLQDLKTAHQRRMEVEEKVYQIDKMAVALRSEVEKMSSVQDILDGQVRSFKQKVEDQRAVIKEKEAVNQQLITKIDDLSGLCQQANKKVDLDASVIQKHESTIKEQNQKLGECNDFITFVREREVKIAARLGQLEEYYEAKRHQSCMFLRRNNRRPSHPAEDIVLDIGKLLVKDEIQTQSPTAAVRQVM